MAQFPLPGDCSIDPERERTDGESLGDAFDDCGRVIQTGEKTPLGEIREEPRDGCEKSEESRNAKGLNEVRRRRIDRDRQSLLASELDRAHRCATLCLSKERVAGNVKMACATECFRID